ncbi:MAG: organic hydroperoxide resistance protein [Methylacidiphilales bacterium]|nr:organic hydroperoxide resistance protein [Candidatus Methylacidiphilales bacterium]
MKVLDTISATTTGGRDGHGQTADGKLNVKFSLMKALGGKGDGITPEHLFAQGYSACFGSALQYVAGQKKIHLSPDFSITAKVEIGQTDEGNFQLEVELTAKAPGVEKAQIEELVKTAHTVCPYSRAIKGNVPVKLSVA